MIQLTPDFNAAANQANRKQPGYLPLARLDEARTALVAGGQDDIPAALIRSQVKTGGITSVSLGANKLMPINSNGVEVTKLSRALVAGSIDPRNLATAGRLAERLNQPYAAIVDALHATNFMPSGIVTKVGGEMYNLDAALPVLSKHFGIELATTSGPSLLTPTSKGATRAITAVTAGVTASVLAAPAAFLASAASPAAQPALAITSGATAAHTGLFVPAATNVATPVAGASAMSGLFDAPNIKQAGGESVTLAPAVAPGSTAKKPGFDLFGKGKEIAAKLTNAKTAAAPASATALVTPAAPLIGAPSADLIAPAGAWSLSDSALATRAADIPETAKRFQPPVFGGNPTPGTGSGAMGGFEKTVAKAAQVTGKAKAPAVVLGGIAAVGTLGAGVLAGAANNSPGAFATTGLMTAAALGTYAVIGAKADAKLAGIKASGIPAAASKLNGKAAIAITVGAMAAGAVGAVGTLALPDGDLKSGFKAATLATTAVSGALAVGSLVLGKGGSARVFRNGAAISAAMLGAEFGVTSLQRSKKPAHAAPRMTPVAAVTSTTEGK